MLNHEESKLATSYVLLSVNMMSTLNFEYEYGFHDIKICMNASPSPPSIILALSRGVLS